MAHEIPYVATATVADLRDIEFMVDKAIAMRGARYIHILVTCPLGWGCASGTPGTGGHPSTTPRPTRRSRRT